MGIEFNSFTTTNPYSLLLIDGLNLAFRWRDYDEFTNEYIKVVRSLAKSYKAGRIIIAADKGSSSFRKELYPEYKANRKEKYANQTEEEKAKFEAFFNAWEECLLVLEQDFTVLRFDGVEADDIAAFIVRAAKDFGIESITLASSDKDWDLLINEYTKRFSYVTRKETTLETWSDHYEWEPHQYVDVKAIMGDSGDNIIGIAGIGPKRAKQLVDQYGSVFDILQNMPLPGKQKFIQQLNASKDVLERNMQLVDLLTHCEEAIGADNIDKIIEVLNG